MADIKKVISNTLKKEGLYSDNKYDSGGKTMYGITKWLAMYHGYFGRMKNLPLIKAYEIYELEFARKLKISLFEDQDIANLVFRIAVHTGRKFAVKSFQNILNVLNRMEKDWKDIKVDGKIGNETLGCFNKALKIRYRKNSILKLLKIIYGYERFYQLARKREKDEMFINGWLNKNIKL